MNTIFAKSVPGRCACRQESDAPRAADMLPPALLRARPPRLPQCSELDVVRHFTELSQRNYSVDANFYPLGSCTMKYNPKFTEYVAALPGFSRLHPLLAQSGRGAACVQGALQCLYEAEALLCEVTGMRAFTFQPMAGANGEFTGVKLIAAYHKAKGRNRKKMLTYSVNVNKLIACRKLFHSSLRPPWRDLKLSIWFRATAWWIRRPWPPL